MISVEDQLKGELDIMEKRPGYLILVALDREIGIHNPVQANFFMQGMSAALLKSNFPPIGICVGMPDEYSMIIAFKDEIMRDTVFESFTDVIEMVNTMESEGGVNHDGHWKAT
jgi:hypothetical protein